MIKITKTKEKLTPAKQNIQLDGIYVKDLKFKDDSFREKMREPWIGDVLRDIFF